MRVQIYDDVQNMLAMACPLLQCSIAHYGTYNYGLMWHCVALYLTVNRLEPSVERLSR